MMCTALVVPNHLSPPLITLNQPSLYFLVEGGGKKDKNDVYKVGSVRLLCPHGVKKRELSVATTRGSNTVEYTECKWGVSVSFKAFSPGQASLVMPRESGLSPNSAVSMVGMILIDPEGMFHCASSKMTLTQRHSFIKKYGVFLGLITLECLS